MPYINVNDAYILDNTGKQVDDAVDYALANSNRNLLDNPWFTVNQRGVSGTLTGNYGYCFDRWKLAGGGSNSSMTIGSDGRTITLNGTTQYAQFRQNLEPILCNSLMGKTVTLSCLFSDGNIFAATFTPTSEAQYTKYMANNRSYLCLDLRTSQRCAFVLINGESRTIKAMKLELGSYSTLANDVPPDYGTELRKCMYYFQRIRQQNSYTLCVGFGEAMNSTTNIRITIPTAVPMRHQASAMSAVPTGTGTMQIVGNGQLLPVTAVSGLGVTGNAVVVNVTVSTSGAYNHIYGLRFTNNSTYIDLSADL